MYIVELEKGVYICDVSPGTADGDPSRTLVEDRAKTFTTKRAAEYALENARHYWPFADAEIKELP